MRERNSDHPRHGQPMRRDERRRSGGRHPGGGRHGGSKGAPWHSRPREGAGTVVLYGWHTVKAALENPRRRFHRLLATENAARRLAEDKVALPLAPTLVRPEDIAAIAGPEAVHQGLCAVADSLDSP